MKTSSRSRRPGSGGGRRRGRTAPHPRPPPFPRRRARRPVGGAGALSLLRASSTASPVAVGRPRPGRCSSRRCSKPSGLARLGHVGTSTARAPRSTQAMVAAMVAPRRCGAHRRRARAARAPTRKTCGWADEHRVPQAQIRRGAHRAAAIALRSWRSPGPDRARSPRAASRRRWRARRHERSRETSATRRRRRRPRTREAGHGRHAPRLCISTTPRRAARTGAPAPRPAPARRSSPRVRRRRARARPPRARWCDGDQHARAASSPHHTAEARQLLGGVDGGRARAGRLGADVDHVRALGEHALRLAPAPRPARRRRTRPRTSRGSGSGSPSPALRHADRRSGSGASSWKWPSNSCADRQSQAPTRP